MEVRGNVERLAGVAKEERVCAGGEVTESIVDEVSGGGSEDVADRAEVVGQGPEDFGGRGVCEEFVLLVRRPEVMVRDGSVVNLDGGLVVFRDEYGFGIADYLTDPDVVVIVGVFNDLNGFPSLRFRFENLLGYLREAVAVVPRVQFTLRTGGVGF